MRRACSSGTLGSSRMKLEVCTELLAADPVGDHRTFSILPPAFKVSVQVLCLFVIIRDITCWRLNHPVTALVDASEYTFANS